MPSSHDLDFYYEIQSMLQERGLDVEERRQDALDFIENFLSVDIQGVRVRAATWGRLPTPEEGLGRPTQRAQAERDGEPNVQTTTPDRLNSPQNSWAPPHLVPNVPPFITHIEWEAAMQASEPIQQQQRRINRTVRQEQQQEHLGDRTANQAMGRSQVARGLGTSGGGLILPTSGFQGDIGLAKWDVRYPKPIAINEAGPATLPRTHHSTNGAILRSWEAIIANDRTPMFLRLPRKIHNQIFIYLNPIEECCLSIVNKYMHMLLPIKSKSQGGYSLLVGSPGEGAILGPDSCRHCLPALYFPRHCELNFHLKSSMPKDTRFCAACVKYTHHCPKGLYDSMEYCGKCDVSYRQRFKRGRRRLVTSLKDENSDRIFKKPRWFNKSVDLY